MGDAAQISYAKVSNSDPQGGGITGFPSNSWKCNKLVADAYSAGSGVGLSVGPKPHGNGTGKGFPASRDSGGTWPPLANSLAQKEYDLRSLTNARDLDETRTVADSRAHPEPGDIIAFPAQLGSGHSSLYIGNGLVISAKGTGVEVGTIASERSTHNGVARIRKFTGSGQ
ncbi:MAG: NlpC/P60 family protein [Planctomycetaceae bacterium]